MAKVKKKLSQVERKMKIYKKIHLEMCEQMGLDPNKVSFTIAKNKKLIEK
jgi:hypothetical protein